MKIIFKTLTILTLVFSLTSCSSDDDGGSSSQNTFTAKIDGMDFNPQFASGVLAPNGGIAGIITITGNNNDGKTVGIIVPQNAVAGTYMVDFMSQVNTNYGGFYQVSDNVDDGGGISASGSITITAHNPNNRTISGTFNFTTGPSPGDPFSGIFEITEGEFDVTYISTDDN